MMRGRLTLVMKSRCPFEQLHRTTDERARGNDRVGMKSGQKHVPVEAIHSAAEPCQAIDNVLPVEQLLEPGQLVLRNCAAHQAEPPPFLAISKLYPRCAPKP